MVVMDALTLILFGVLPALTIAAGLHDLTTMKIPNWIPGLLILGFFPAALAAGFGPLDIALHFGVGVGALFVGMALFALNWVGGGDAKLLAAVCLWMGASGSAVFLIFTALFGGAFCLALIFARGHMRALAVGGPAWASRLLEPKGDIPYGVAIAAGALLAFPQSELMLRFGAGS